MNKIEGNIYKDPCGLTDVVLAETLIYILT